MPSQPIPATATTTAASQPAFSGSSVSGIGPVEFAARGEQQQEQHGSSKPALGMSHRAQQAARDADEQQRHGEVEGAAKPPLQSERQQQQSHAHQRADEVRALDHGEPHADAQATGIPAAARELY